MPTGHGSRLELNNPPISTGGIREDADGHGVGLELNNPPVSTGGIR
jgi:hypothetical protein